MTSKNNISLDIIYNLVSEVSHLEKPDIVKKGLKLNEEVGELSAEILKLVNYKYHTNTNDEIRENILSESVDSLIMIFDILVSQNYTKEEIVETSSKKIQKWLEQMKKSTNI